MASVYKINKGVNQPVIFKGLKAQYIWWLGGGLVALLLLFVILYIIGVNMFVCLGLITILGTILFKKVYAMSKKYGEYDLLKSLAKKRVPKLIKSGSRRIYQKRQAPSVSARSFRPVIGMRKVVKHRCRRDH